MFELLFKYPAAVFSKGTFVLLGGWPFWLLVAAILAAGVGLALLVRSRASGSVRVAGARSVVVWLLQTAAGGGAAVDVVASGAQRRDAAAAAEYRRGRGGRFRQHGRR